jgi:hypothetical protein
MLTSLLLVALISFASGVLFMIVFSALYLSRRPAPPLPRSSRPLADDGLGRVVPLHSCAPRHRTRFSFIRAITHGGAAPRF